MNYEQLKELTAPKIVGNALAKEILLLHLFLLPVNEKEKLHSLFVGATGSAKSRLLDYFELVYPLKTLRSNYSTTIAGLIGKSGYYGMEGGVLAELGKDGLTWCADELEKTTHETKIACLELMQEQQSTVIKSGQKDVIQTKLNVIATANPRSEKWFGNPTINQINFEPHEISRFFILLPFYEASPDWYEEIGFRMYSDVSKDESKMKEYVKKIHSEIPKVYVSPEMGRKMGKMIGELKLNSNKLASAITPRYIEGAGSIVTAKARMGEKSEPDDEELHFTKQLYLRILNAWVTKKKPVGSKSKKPRRKLRKR